MEANTTGPSLVSDSYYDTGFGANDDATIIETTPSSLVSTPSSKDFEPAKDLAWQIKEKKTTLGLDNAQASQISTIISKTQDFPYAKDLLETAYRLIEEASRSDKTEKLKLHFKQLTTSINALGKLTPEALTRFNLCVSLSGKENAYTALNKVMKNCIMDEAHTYKRMHGFYDLGNTKLCATCHEEFSSDVYSKTEVSTTLRRQYSKQIRHFHERIRTVLGPAALAHHVASHYLAKIEKLEESKAKSNNSEKTMSIEQAVTAINDELIELTGSRKKFTKQSDKNREQRYQELHTAIAKNFNKLVLGSAKIDTQNWPQKETTTKQNKTVPFLLIGPFSIVVKTSDPKTPLLTFTDSAAELLKHGVHLVDSPVKCSYPAMLELAQSITNVKQLIKCCEVYRPHGIIAGIESEISSVALSPLQKKFDEFWDDPEHRKKLEKEFSESKLDGMKNFCSYIYCPYIKAIILHSMDEESRQIEALENDVAVLAHIPPTLSTALLENPSLDKEALLIQASRRLSSMDSTVFKRLAATNVDPINAIAIPEEKLSVLAVLITNASAKCVKPFIRSSNMCSTSASPEATESYWRVPMILHAAASNLELFKYMVEKLHAPMNVLGISDSTLAHYGALSDNPDTLEYLCNKHNTDMLKTNTCGMTPINYAIKFSKFESLKYLLNNVDKIRLSKDGWEQTPLEYTKNRMNNPEINSEDKKQLEKAEFLIKESEYLLVDIDQY